MRLKILITAWVICFSALGTKIQPIPRTFIPMDEAPSFWQHRAKTQSKAALIHIETRADGASETWHFVFNRPLPRTRLQFDAENQRILLHFSQMKAHRLKLSEIRRLSANSKLVSALVIHPRIEGKYLSTEIELSQDIVFSPHIPKNQPWKLVLHLSKKPQALH